MFLKIPSEISKPLQSLNYLRNGNPAHDPNMYHVTYHVSKFLNILCTSVKFKKI